MRIEEIPREPTPTNIDITLANIVSSVGPQKQYDFDFDTVIKDLQMSYRSDDEDSSQRMENASKDSLIEELDTFFSMKKDIVTINRCYSKQKHPQGLQDVQGHIEEFKVKKIGWTGRKHAINYNVDEMVNQGIEKEHKIKELKKELADKNKLVKEIEAAKMSVEYVKLQASLNMGIMATKEALVNDIMRIVNELSLQMTALVDEHKVEENTIATVSQLLQTF